MDYNVQLDVHSSLVVFERRAEGGKPTRLVTEVDVAAFGKLWLEVAEA
jgi:hypothetical protein